MRIAELFWRYAGNNSTAKDLGDGRDGLPLCGANANGIEELVVVLLLTIPWDLVAARVSR